MTQINFFLMSILKKGETQEALYGKVKAKIQNETCEDSSILISDRRFILIYQNNLRLEFSQQQLKDGKLQKKESKDNPTTAKSQSILRIVVDGQPFLFTFTGENCNKVMNEVIEQVQKLKNREIVETPISTDDEKESYSTLSSLSFDNKIVTELLKDERFSKDRDMIPTVFQAQLVKYFAEHMESKQGYSSRDHWLQAQQADTSAGANIIQYNLDSQIIRQLLRRRPKLLQLFREKVRDRESEKAFFERDFLQYLKEYRENETSRNESNQDITQHNEGKKDERLRNIDEKAKIDELFDNPNGHGVLRKDEFRPDDMTEVLEINNHSQLVLMSTGIVPDTTTTPDGVNYQQVPISKPEDLEDLSDKQGKTYEPLEIHDTPQHNAQISKQSSDFVEETPQAQDEWIQALRFFDNNVQSFQQSRQENPNQMFVIDEIGCKNVLLEMGFDRATSRFYEQNDPDFIQLAKQTAELQIIATIYWLAFKGNKKDQMERIRAIINDHRDQVLNKSYSQESYARLDPLIENLKQMYASILQGTDQIQTVKSQYNSSSFQLL